MACAGEPDNLTKFVGEMIVEGWQPYGAMVSYPVNFRKVQLLQPMVKYEDDATIHSPTSQTPSEDRSSVDHSPAPKAPVPHP